MFYQFFVRAGSALLIAFCLALANISTAGIAVEPAYVSLNFDKGGRASGRFVVTNTGDSEERYRVVASHFTFDEGGTLALAEPDEHSMAEWIKFNPKEFTLPPNSKRAVRYVVLPRGKLKDGQYWAAMELESLDGRDYSTADGEGRTFNLKVVPSVLAPMYGKAGSVTHKFDIESFELKRNERNIPVLEMKVKNLGNAVINFKGRYELLDQAREKVAEGSLDGGLLLRDKKRSFVSYIQPKVPAGDYILSVTYAAPGLETPMNRELELKIAN